MILDLHPKVEWRLQDLAERAGISVEEVISDAVMPKEHHLSASGEHTRVEVVRLHGLGLTDEEIAAQVDRVQGHVARLRRAAGLKPNKRKKENHGED